MFSFRHFLDEFNFCLWSLFCLAHLSAVCGDPGACERWMTIGSGTGTSLYQMTHALLLSGFSVSLPLYCASLIVPTAQYDPSGWVEFEMSRT